MEEFEEIYLKYAVPVKKYAMTLCGDENTADDIAAETFFKALKNIDSYDGSCKILTWLCTIAKNTYLDFLKKKKALPLYEAENMVSDGDSPEKSVLRNEDRLRLFRLIQNLEPDAKDVVYLRIFGELSFREIGDILGKSENWARVLFYRTKVKMKGMIDNE